MTHCEEYSEPTSHRVKKISDIYIMSSYKNYADSPNVNFYHKFRTKKSSYNFLSQR